MNPLLFSWGRVVGSDHVKSKKNCQDAFLIEQRKDLVVGMVSDGCGDSQDSPYSEIGSRIGVVTVVNQIITRLENTSRWRWNHHLEGLNFWQEVQKYTLERIDDTARGMGGSYSKNVINHFLFTLVGMVITPEITLFVGVGDGYYFLNGEMNRMMPVVSDNMPVYLAYNLVETNLKNMPADVLKLSVRKTVTTNSVFSAMVATDGLDGILANPKKLIPGTKEEVGGPERFWQNKDFFNNPFSLGWRLNQLASEKRNINWNEGRVEIQSPILTDDLSLVVASRL